MCLYPSSRPPPPLRQARGPAHREERLAGAVAGNDEEHSGEGGAALLHDALQRRDGDPEGETTDGAVVVGEQGCGVREGLGIGKGPGDGSRGLSRAPSLQIQAEPRSSPGQTHQPVSMELSCTRKKVKPITARPRRTTGALRPANRRELRWGNIVAAIDVLITN
jgi:hypothetical protein